MFNLAFGKISPAKNRKKKKKKKKAGHEMCLLKENFNAVKVLIVHRNL
jgi:hypothetical protein